MSYTGKPDSVQSAYSELLLPDISDILGKSTNSSVKSEFPAKYQEMELIISRTGSRNVKESGNKMFTLINAAQFTALKKEDVDQSDRSHPLGNITIESEDIIHIFPGELIRKNGKFRIDFSIATGEGILKGSFDMKGSGSFQVEKL